MLCFWRWDHFMGGPPHLGASADGWTEAVK